MATGLAGAVRGGADVDVAPDACGTVFEVAVDEPPVVGELWFAAAPTASFVAAGGGVAIAGPKPAAMIAIAPTIDVLRMFLPVERLNDAKSSASR